MADPPPSRRALRAARMDPAETPTGQTDPAHESSDAPLIDRVPDAAPLVAPIGEASPAFPLGAASSFPAFAPAAPAASPGAEDFGASTDRFDTSGFKKLFSRSIEPEWTPGPRRSDPASGRVEGIGALFGAASASGGGGAAATAPEPAPAAGPAPRGVPVPADSGPLTLEALFAPTGPVDIVESAGRPDSSPAPVTTSITPIDPSIARIDATPAAPDSGPLLLAALFAPTGPVEIVQPSGRLDSSSPVPVTTSTARIDATQVAPDSGPLTLSSLFGPVDTTEAPDARQPGYARTSGPAADASVFSFTASAAPVAPPAAEAVTTPPLVSFEPQSPAATKALPPTTSGAAGSGIALAWVDESTIAARPRTSTDLAAAASPYVPVENDLLGRPPHRSPLRPGVLIPTAAALALVGAYAATTLLWPLNAVEPQVESIQAQPIPAAPAAMPWPGVGSAAVDVRGIDGIVASSGDMAQMASITKVVTALVVLEELPLAPGEQGPSYRFSYSDRYDYWDYLDGGESALDVPVGESLTEYQLLQGMLIGSANNYADRLASSIWPSNRVFADAANSWLAAHGVPGITIVEPTGIDAGNAATPEALLVLAEKALANPVIAEIVATPAVELPGAGYVENTNGLLADPGVIGIKTGTLDSWNLLSAKNLTIGETTVRVSASVLGQPDNDSRLAVSRALYAQLEAELQPKPSVTTGTTTGLVKTKWGEPVDIVTSADVAVILWNGGVGTVTTNFTLGDARTKGDKVGTLTVAGPLDTKTVDMRLADDIEEPSAWWRLTHPLDLFGLSGD